MIASYLAVLLLESVTTVTTPIVPDAVMVFETNEFPWYSTAWIYVLYCVIELPYVPEAAMLIFNLLLL